ncbi:ankyrin repeat domain-containing protein [Flavobacterium sp.]|uniref:ankyrin repeat domain-containing protein n=1 Tax=Flavobacterium sp. TaxID=239 RepID=UPI00261184A8|nr:ankyrin repeat domain-containing protein [Flavobacterium sp.]
MIKKIVLFVFLNSFFGFCQQKDIFLVARNGNVVEMESILKESPSALNSKNEYGFSPLILACYKSNNDVARYLIEKKADLDYVSQEGTALMAATVKGNAKLVELLLSNNANPNLTDEKGTTALMYAVQFKNEEIIQLLLKYKADKTKINNEGKTAFEFAVFSKNDNIINLLK